MDQIIKSLHEIPPEGSLYGGKADNIIKLHRYERFRVPKSWAICADILTDILKGKGFSHDENGFFLTERESIYRFIDEEFPKEIYRELWQEVSGLFKENRSIKYYAVRSSHRIEDGKENSFAGQFTTFLNLSNTSNLVHSIIKCWRDSFSETIASYMKLIGLDRIEPCSILLQQLIHSACAGVIFRSDEGIIIHANWGMCKHIVDGMSGYDEWVYIFDQKSWSGKTGNKETATIPVYERVNPALGEKVIGLDLPGRVKMDIVQFDNKGSVIDAYLPEELKLAPCMDQDLAEELEKTASAAAFAVGIEQYDAEWCLTPDRQLYLLQIRPLTRSLDLVGQREWTEVSPNLFQGMRLVSGKAEGFGYKVSSERDALSFPPGGIIIAKSLIGPALHAALKASGCIVQAHSVISHSAIIARELGLPTVGAIDIDRMDNGKYYEVDGDKGIVGVSEGGVRQQEAYRAEEKPAQSAVGDVYDLRPILTTLMFFTYIPDGILDELSFAAGYAAEINCEGFEQCDDANTLLLWNDAVSRFPDHVRFLFDGNKGNFVEHTVTVRPCRYEKRKPTDPWRLKDE